MCRPLGGVTRSSIRRVFFRSGYIFSKRSGSSFSEVRTKITKIRFAITPDVLFCQIGHTSEPNCGISFKSL